MIALYMMLLLWTSPQRHHTSPLQIKLVADTILVDSLVVRVNIHGPTKDPTFMWELSDIGGLTIRDDTLRVTIYRAFPTIHQSRRTLKVTWNTPFGTVQDSIVFQTKNPP